MCVCVVYEPTCLYQGNTSPALRKLGGAGPLQPGPVLQVEREQLYGAGIQEIQTGCTGGSRQEGFGMAVSQKAHLDPTEV